MLIAKIHKLEYNTYCVKQKESKMLTLIFIVLKLTNVLKCSWWWILLTLALDGGLFGRIF